MPLIRPVAALVFVLAIAAYYFARLTTTFGTAWDDGLYLVGGAAISQGDGYRLIQDPEAPFCLLFPPLYPAVLSLVWLLWPQFPDNLWAFKSLNIVAGVVALGLIGALVTRVYQALRAVGVLTAVLLALSPLYHHFIDTTMSEMIFMPLVLLGLLATERFVADTRPRAPWLWLGVALLAALPVYTRTAGLALGISVIGCLIMHRRLKAAAGFMVAYAAAGLPWFWWISHVKRTGAASTLNNASWFYSHTGGFAPDTLLATLSANTQAIFQTALPLVLLPSMASGYGRGVLTKYHLEGIAIAIVIAAIALFLVGLVASLRKRLRVFHLYLLVSVLMILPYPLADAVRYMMALSPLILYCLAEGIVWLARGNWLGPWRDSVRHQALAVGLAAVVVALGLAEGLHQVANLVQARAGHGATLTDGRRPYNDDLASAAGWIRAHAPANAVLLYYRDPQLYLLTRRSTIAGVEAGRFDRALRLAKTQPVYLVHVADTDGEANYQRFLALDTVDHVKCYTAPHRLFTIYQIRS
ncbi:hypothetical protein D3C72_698340 [compost metagenome]